FSHRGRSEHFCLTLGISPTKMSRARATDRMLRAFFGASPHQVRRPSGTAVALVGRIPLRRTSTMASTICMRASVIAIALAIPAIASAQGPDSFKTPGDATRVKTELLCAPGFAASLKPVAKWQREQALERYGIRPERFDGTLDHLIPASLGG